MRQLGLKIDKNKYRTSESRFSGDIDGADLTEPSATRSRTSSTLRTY